VPFASPNALFNLTRRLVAAPRHCHRAHQTRPSPAKWPS
jgi:hypothetical protein